MPGGIDMYLKLNNYEYKITAANVGFEMSEDNKSLIMFLDIDGSYEGEDLDVVFDESEVPTDPMKLN